MNATANGSVALLIDFENLVRGVADPDSLDTTLLLRLAEQHGRVLLANAYADWRNRDVNQYQVELHRHGIELVHVFGQNYKNAVDVRLAVDAIETIWSMPHIDVFVIVSGDRDFIHVVKSLRRHGRTVVGVSPSRSASSDLATLCDRFVRFESLVATYDAPGETDRSGEESHDSQRAELGVAGVRPRQAVESKGTLDADQGGRSSSAPCADLDSLREQLQSIVEGQPDGVKGAMIKPTLRRIWSPTFDESDYGFSRLTDLLRTLDDVVRVEMQADGSDILVFAAGTPTITPSHPVAEPPVRALLKRSNLAFYRFERDPDLRRRILTQLHEVLSARERFAWVDVEETLSDRLVEMDVAVSVTLLSRYRTMLLQSRILLYESDQDMTPPQRERTVHLDEKVTAADDVIRLYEASVAYKLLDAATDGSLAATDLATVLGLPPTDPDEFAYCEELIAIAREAGADDASD